MGSDVLHVFAPSASEGWKIHQAACGAVRWLFLDLCGSGPPFILLIIPAIDLQVIINHFSFTIIIFEIFHFFNKVLHELPSTYLFRFAEKAGKITPKNTKQHTENRLRESDQNVPTN